MYRHRHVINYTYIVVRRLIKEALNSELILTLCVILNLNQSKEV